MDLILIELSTKFLKRHRCKQEICRLTPSLIAFCINLIYHHGDQNSSSRELITTHFPAFACHSIVRLHNQTFYSFHS